MTKSEHDSLVEDGATPVEGFGPYQVKIGVEVTSNADRAMMLLKLMRKQSDNEIKSCPECERPNQFGELCGRCAQ